MYRWQLRGTMRGDICGGGYLWSIHSIQKDQHGEAHVAAASDKGIHVRAALRSGSGSGIGVRSIFIISGM